MRIVFLLLAAFLLSCSSGMSKADKAEIKRLEWARDSMLYRMDSLIHKAPSSPVNRGLVKGLEIDIIFNRMRIDSIKSKYD